MDRITPNRPHAGLLPAERLVGHPRAITPVSPAVEPAGLGLSTLASMLDLPCSLAI